MRQILFRELAEQEGLRAAQRYLIERPVDNGNGGSQGSVKDNLQRSWSSRGYNHASPGADTHPTKRSTQLLRFAPSTIAFW